jgi:Smg protein
MVKVENSFEAPRTAEAGRERIIEIIFFLLNEIRENTPLAEIDLKPLSVRGFSETEISTAFSWLIDRFASGPDDNPLVLAVPFGKRSVLDSTKAEASFRVYHEVERSVIAPEARGFMLQLLELGLISDADQEFLIDRIMLSGATTASLEEVKDLVAHAIFHFDSAMFPQGRMMLSGGSDRVH